MTAQSHLLDDGLLQAKSPRSALPGGKVLSLLGLLVGFGVGYFAGNRQQMIPEEDSTTALAATALQPGVQSGIRQIVPPMKAQHFAQPAAAADLALKSPQPQAMQFMPQTRLANSAPMAGRAQPPVVQAVSPKVDLTGKVAFLAGADSETGYGWAIAKELADAGATILYGVWPPALKIFQMNWKKSNLDEAKKLPNGELMEVAKTYALDAVYDTPEDVPEDIANNKRYKGVGGFTIQEVVDQVEKDYGKIDILVHSLANGPEVKKPLLETSREGYLAASSASAYSLVSMVSRFGKIMNPGGAVVSLTYIASNKVIPGYGGGMSSAKAQLESDTRTLAYEAGRKFGIRVNTISAGPLASRAATAIGNEPGEKPFIVRAREYSEVNSPISTPLVSTHIGTSAFFLLTELGAGVTGVVLPVDMGLHAMGQSLDSPAFEGLLS
eukprot:gnl/TRDRNA2_/TRDRNA2_179325_c0_seq1.p1 gnl/TRDRNA2_/TRDRNA2_179325_c0~~gnl/TRDRNA2_/TRDRNA2_179325_c0_seq1.p1  ORF type:complete len:465 (+),score=91.77 gnl/TRDRNA2_/TRDRNA2_179325_c0_seq1:79-1395(+)